MLHCCKFQGSARVRRANNLSVDEAGPLPPVNSPYGTWTSGDFKKISAKTKINSIWGPLATTKVRMYCLLHDVQISSEESSYLEHWQNNDIFMTKGDNSSHLKTIVLLFKWAFFML